MILRIRSSHELQFFHGQLLGHCISQLVDIQWFHVKPYAAVKCTYYSWRTLIVFSIQNKTIALKRSNNLFFLPLFFTLISAPQKTRRKKPGSNLINEIHSFSKYFFNNLKTLNIKNNPFRNLSPTNIEKKVRFLQILDVCWICFGLYTQIILK